ncbi:MAG TPA: hypothetical protein VGH38_18175 [Bryobacteraceae bacterium]|jgi:succinate dehydrogenase flavin-adding protein (antitoxin of CptAB toxin-antitoxin module)
MPKAKLTTAIYLLLVFSSGVMVGAVAHRLYMVKTVLGTDANPVMHRLGPAEWRKQFIDDMRTKVKMDDRQLVALQQILDQTDEELRQIHAGRKDEDARRRTEDQVVQNAMVEKITGMLREDQRPLYQQLRAEREAVRERERKRRAQGEPKK